MQQAEFQLNDRALLFDELRNIIPLGRTFIYKLIKEGDFPPPVKVGRRSLWSEIKVRAWWANRLANPPAKGRPASYRQAKRQK